MFAKTICIALLSASWSAYTAQGAPAVDDLALHARIVGNDLVYRAQQAKGSAGKVKTSPANLKATSSVVVKGAVQTSSGKAAATTAAGKAAGAVASASAASSAAASSTASSAASAAASSAAGASNGTTGDPQSSLTLDPAVICQNFTNNGQDVPTAGQVPSLTSSNNFINFCLTVNAPLTNGAQVAGGSCNPAPMGVIPSKTSMPSCKFTFPENFGTVAANTAFNISMAVQNMVLGNFVNANENYFSAPQTLQGGLIKGHSHVVVQLMKSINDPTPLDPEVFAFFKGLNDAGNNGVLTASVDKGLPAGVYRVASINTAANHQPVLVPVAQHGSLDDMVYFTVTDGGAAAPSGSGTAGAGTATQTGGATSTNQDIVSTPAAASSGAASSSAKASSTKAKSAPAKPTSKKHRGKGGRRF